MAAPELAFIKSWCRIDGDEFDAILPAMIADATARASHETGVDYTQEDMPSSVSMWCAAQVAHWLAAPEAAGGELKKNPFLDGLLDMHRKYGLEAV